MARWITHTVWTVVVILATIGVVVAVRRMLDVAGIVEVAVNPRAPGFDAGFARLPPLTMAHIVPGVLFMVLAPLQFVRRIRVQWPQLHRLLGRLFVAASVVIGVTGLIMSFTLPIGDGIETAATAVFSVLFLFALWKAVLHVRRGAIAPHREWMIRAFAIGLAVATIRPIVGLFFALTALSPREFFGIAFWIGFTLHLVLAEIWIVATRPRLGGGPSVRAPLASGPRPGRTTTAAS